MALGMETSAGSAAPPPWLQVAAEAALIALTLAGVVGLTRLFDDASFLVPVLGFALGGHALAIACRRLGVGPGLTAALATGGLAAAVSLLLLPETTRFAIPTPATLSQAGRELSDALTVFRDVVAPAPVEPGFVLAAALAVWTIAVVADTAAFRSGARVEAVVPAATLFLFGAALGVPGRRLALTALFLAALASYWLTQRLLSHARAPNRMTTDTGAGPRALLRSGAVLAAAAVMAGVVVGPFLPGAEADAVIPWRAGERDGAGSRVTVSPLVDIRSRLVDQSEVEVFTVSTDARSYWRLTSLEIFDGRIWSSRGQYQRVDGSLPDSSAESTPATRMAVQDFEIAALASIWLPAAYRAVGIAGTDARFDADSGSLLTEEETASGLTYRVESEVRALGADELNQVPDSVPAEVAQTYTALPPEFSSRVAREAASVTSGGATPYERARLLQDHFRSGAFTYDLAIAPGHGGDDLERFLFETRRGYCEQFAGAFAAMARAIGLPARVAVGFTPGEQDGDGVFHVRGLNAHAWPEVFLSGYGWVAFEPTPGRGIPNAEAYTGVPEQQATPADPTTATTRPPTQASVPPTTLPGIQEAPTADPGQGPPAGADDGLALPSWLGRVALVLLVPAAGLGSWWATLEWVRRRRRARRRAGARTPAERVLVIWAEVGEALAVLGSAPRRWETPIEYAQRAGGTTGVDHRLLNALAGVTTAAGYGPAGMDEKVAERAAKAGADVQRGVEAQLGVPARVRRALDPRPLLPERERRLQIHAHGISST
jgi:transglutaminase-like putative cysteine protease